VSATWPEAERELAALNESVDGLTLIAATGSQRMKKFAVSPLLLSESVWLRSGQVKEALFINPQITDAFAALKRFEQRSASGLLIAAFLATGLCSTERRT
jgi:hypothetical protein